MKTNKIIFSQQLPDVEARVKTIIDILDREGKADGEQLPFLLSNLSKENANYLFSKAREKADQVYGKTVYLRGLIEFSNYCKMNCYYCGLRYENQDVKRYRMSLDDILKACELGYGLGYRTFVLQSGEDTWWTDDKIIIMVKEIRVKYPDCGITLSIGERSKEFYANLKQAGADRFLLRHEAASKGLYDRLHPDFMSWDNRMECIQNIKQAGLQTGVGMMIGAPFQTINDIVEDILFIKSIDPHMVGIGPFIAHSKTPFKDYEDGSADAVATVVAIVRLMNPKVLLPATTALGSVDPIGREKSLLAGANVMMPKITDKEIRKNYQLYEKGVSLDEDPLDVKEKLIERIHSVGLTVDFGKGDSKNIK